MKRKYIKIYEEYTDLEEKSLEGHYSWQDVRDTIQSKLPFIIIDFKDQEAFDKCIKEELFDEKYIKQTYHLKSIQDGELKKYNSVFIFGESKDLKDRVLDLIKRFNILRIIIGEYGKVVPQLYVDGENVDIGSNLYAAIEEQDMGGDDYYRIDSNFYKFID